MSKIREKLRQHDALEAGWYNTAAVRELVALADDMKKALPLLREAKATANQEGYHVERDQLTHLIRRIREFHNG